MAFIDWLNGQPWAVVLFDILFWTYAIRGMIYVAWAFLVLVGRSTGEGITYPRWLMAWMYLFDGLAMLLLHVAVRDLPINTNVLSFTIRFVWFLAGLGMIGMSLIHARGTWERARNGE